MTENMRFLFSILLYCDFQYAFVFPPVPHPPPLPTPILI